MSEAADKPSGAPDKKCLVFPPATGEWGIVTHAIIADGAQEGPDDDEAFISGKHYARVDDGPQQWEPIVIQVHPNITETYPDRKAWQLAGFPEPETLEDILEAGTGPCKTEQDEVE